MRNYIAIPAETQSPIDCVFAAFKILMFAALFFVIFGETALSQNKFFGTPNRSGVEGARGNAQIKMLMDENVERGKETAANADSIEAMMSDLADVEPHAKAALAACASSGKVLQWNSNTWTCVDEADPTVGAHARTADVPPYCHETNSKLIWSLDNGGSWKCVPEGDIKIGTLYQDHLCRASGNKVICDQPKAITGQCRFAASSPTLPYAFVLCNADEQLISGGGSCANGAAAYLHHSGPHGINGWAADCYRHDGSGDVPVTAYAICCKKQ